MSDCSTGLRGIISEYQISNAWSKNTPRCAMFLLLLSFHDSFSCFNRKERKRSRYLQFVQPCFCWWFPIVTSLFEPIQQHTQLTLLFYSSHEINEFKWYHEPLPSVKCSWFWGEKLRICWCTLIIKNPTHTHF